IPLRALTRPPQTLCRQAASSHEIQSRPVSALAHWVNPRKGEEPTHVIAQFDAVLHEAMLPDDQRRQQHQAIHRYGDDRSGKNARAAGPMLENVLAAQQRPLEHVSACPTITRNGFIRDALIAPAKHVALLRHSQEEVFVLAAIPEFLSE